jgi:hypothetical protein
MNEARRFIPENQRQRQETNTRDDQAFLTQPTPSHCESPQNHLHGTAIRRPALVTPVHWTLILLPRMRKAFLLSFPQVQIPIDTFCHFDI